MAKVESQELIFSKCPVCKSGKVTRIKPTGFFSFAKPDKLMCEKCNAKFIDRGEKEEEQAYELDLSESDKENKYDGETLKINEWNRGLSDLDYCQLTGKLPNAHIVGLKLILQAGEQTHWYSPAKLMEERAIRRSHGGAVRVMKGVYVGGSQSESHGELRQIDIGHILLTNKRLIFNGKFRHSEFALKKIVSVEEYKDAMEIGASNRKKVQVFVVDEPHKWATFVRIAIEKLTKPEWLKQEEKHKEFFRSEEGISPINIMREKAKEYEKKKEYKQAEEVYRKIAELSKMSSDYSSLGEFYKKRKVFQKALKAYKQALKLEPDERYQRHEKANIEEVEKKLKKK